MRLRFAEGAVRAPLFRDRIRTLDGLRGEFESPWRREHDFRGGPLFVGEMRVEVEFSVTICGMRTELPGYRAAVHPPLGERAERLASTFIWNEFASADVRGVLSSD